MTSRLPQFRSLVQSIDRSLDEARRRRLGLDKVSVPALPLTSSTVNGKLKASRVDRVHSFGEARRTG
jgi:hypothetical protein